MRAFSIGEAIASGFRLPRERPRAMLAWVAVEFVSTLLRTIIAAPLAPAMEQLRQQMSGGAPDPVQVSASLEGMAPRMLLIAALFLVSWSILAAAAARAVLRPEDSRLGYVRFGGGELRVFTAMVVTVAVLFLGYMAGASLLFLLLSFTGPAAMVIGLPFLALGIVWLWSRLSPAAAMTLATGKLQVAGAWNLTRGHARRVFLVNLAALGLNSLVWLLGLLIFAGVIGAVGMTPAEGGASMTWYSVPGLVSLVASAILGALGAAIVLCPPAVIYRDLARAQT